ncbi:MAG: hypothetical protein ALAOOOJD_00501 [bacterium]|nr:hypothetical protein [bacterium]
MQLDAGQLEFGLDVDIFLAHVQHGLVNLCFLRIGQAKFFRKGFARAFAHHHPAMHHATWLRLGHNRVSEQHRCRGGD